MVQPLAVLMHSPWGKNRAEMEHFVLTFSDWGSKFNLEVPKMHAKGEGVVI